MKSDEIKILIKYRLEQAQTALDDAKYEKILAMLNSMEMKADKFCFN